MKLSCRVQREPFSKSPEGGQWLWMASFLPGPAVSSSEHTSVASGLGSAALGSLELYMGVRMTLNFWPSYFYLSAGAASMCSILLSLMLGIKPGLCMCFVKSSSLQLLPSPFLCISLLFCTHLVLYFLSLFC